MEFPQKVFDRQHPDSPSPLTARAPVEEQKVRLRIVGSAPRGPKRKKLCLGAEKNRRWNSIMSLKMEIPLLE
jgi:hypothetical protein